MNIDECHGIVESELFQNGPVVVFVWKNQDDWPVVAVSKNVQRILGYEREDFFSRKAVYAQLLHPEDFPLIASELQGAVESQEYRTSIEHSPYRLRIMSGEYLWIRDTTVFVRNSHGDITHFEGSNERFGKDKPILPGMVANVNILTGKKSILEYLVIPIKRISHNSLREP